MDISDLFFERFEPVTVRRRNGPHWRQDGKLYFVTWRQEDSIPREQRERILAERTAWEQRYGGTPIDRLPATARDTYWRLYHKRVQRYLDNGYGSCVLKQPEPQKIMRNALHHFNGTRYSLGSFAIAANHVHVLVAPRPGIDLSEIQHSWKSFTANAINKALGRTGTLWRPESYDRIVRDEDELARIIFYIMAHEEQGALAQHLLVV